MAQAFDVVLIVLGAVIVLMLLATFFGYAIRGWPEPTRIGKAFLRTFLILFTAFGAVVIGGVIFLFAACLSFKN